MPVFIHPVHLMLNNSVGNLFLIAKTVDMIIVVNPDTARIFVSYLFSLKYLRLSPQSNGSYLRLYIYLELILTGDHHSAMLF